MPVNDRDYALLIGIDKYSRLPTLSGAREDATRIAHWLLSPDGGGLKPENIELITSPDELPSDPDDAVPIQKYIDKAFRDRFRIFEPIPRRRLYFYFSGHGYGATVNDVGMLMAPADTKQINLNIGLKPYLEFLCTWNFFDEIIFFLDCCRDSGLSGSAVAPTFAGSLGNPPSQPNVESFIVLATNHGRKAFEVWDENMQKKRGLLTEIILEGLHEAVDAEGRITAKSLGEYIQKYVPQKAVVNKLKQISEVLGPTKGGIVFKTGVEKRKVIDIFLPPKAKKLMIESQNKKIIQFAKDNTGAWAFKYATKNERLQNLVKLKGIQEHADGTTIKVDLVQNELWYGLKPSPGEMQVLDLRRFNSKSKSHVFKLKT